MSKPFPVIYRIERWGKEENAVAFFPHALANPGFLVNYAHVGQHSEASLGYYQQTKAPRTSAQKAMVAELREEVTRIYESEPDAVKLAERLRLSPDFRRHAWGGR